MRRNAQRLPTTAVTPPRDQRSAFACAPVKKTFSLFVALPGRANVRRSHRRQRHEATRRRPAPPCTGSWLACPVCSPLVVLTLSWGTAPTERRYRDRDESIRILVLSPSSTCGCSTGRLSREVRDAIDRVVASQAFILGDEVRLFEEAIASRLGSPHAIGVASGSDALLLSLLAAGVGRGDEVLTTPFTFFATAGAIARASARPVFVDIDPGTFNLDPHAVAAAIGPATKAVVPVHLFGRCARWIPSCPSPGRAAPRSSRTRRRRSTRSIAVTRPEHSATSGVCRSSLRKTSEAWATAEWCSRATIERADRVRRLRTHGSVKTYARPGDRHEQSTRRPPGCRAARQAPAPRLVAGRQEGSRGEVPSPPRRVGPSGRSHSPARRHPKGGTSTISSPFAACGATRFKRS